MSSPPTGAARKRGAAASATTPRSTLGAPSAGLEPTPEPHRAYLDDPPSRPSRSTLGAPRRGRDLRDERFRREVFDLFEGARSLLSRWSLARFLREWKSRDRTKRAPAEVITIPTDATVGDALSLLARENILSAPVVDADRLRVRARRRDARRPPPDPPPNVRLPPTPRKIKKHRRPRPTARSYPQSLRPSPYPISQFLGFQDVGDFLRDFFFHLDAVLPAPPLPANPVAAAAHAAERAETPGTTTTPTPSTTPAPKPKSKPAASSSSAAAAFNFVAEEARRGWIASATRETLETAGAAFCAKTVGEARANRCGAEDGRMVYAGKGDAPLLDVVRAGFLRHVVEPSTYETDASGDRKEAAEGTQKSRTAADVGRRATACHRVAVYRLDYDPEVMDDTMVIDAVVSQSDVARFLAEHRAELGAALERNLADLGLAPGVQDDEGESVRDDDASFEDRFLAESVECVLPTTRAIEAFSRMRSRGVSSVAVCAEPRGKLVDVLALSDFRGAHTPGDFADLDLSVAEFAAKRRPPGANARLVTVRPDADLGDVLRLMSDNGVHRVFVTDLEGRPTRCVTPTDVFRLVALPSAHNLGWRFQATDAGRATRGWSCAYEEPTPLAPREDEAPPPARRAEGFAGAFDDEM